MTCASSATRQQASNKCGGKKIEGEGLVESTSARATNTVGASCILRAAASWTMSKAHMPQPVIVMIVIVIVMVEV